MTIDKIVDCSLLYMYCDPAVSKTCFDFHEFQVMAITTFSGVLKRLNPPKGEEWRVLGAACKESPEAMFAEMDETGVEFGIMPAIWVWSQRDHKLMIEHKNNKVFDVVKKSEGRIIGGASYNPFRIKESLEAIDIAVKEYGFQYVWFHPISFGMAPNDRRCYPLYTKCMELGIPVGMQVGHSAEPLTSEPGHPMYADDVAIEMPDLKIILTHTGWPWIDEWCSMIWRHPNVYGMCNAYMPSGFYPATFKFMDSPRGRDKVMMGSHAYGMTRWVKECNEMPISDKAKQKILYDNPVKLFNLKR